MTGLARRQEDTKGAGGDFVVASGPRRPREDAFGRYFLALRKSGLRFSMNDETYSLCSALW